MSTTESSTSLALGAVKERKPSAAANLSFLFAGLGQLYCGCFARGIAHMCIIVAILVAAILALATRTGSPVAICLVVAALAIVMTCYSAFDAHRLARHTRSDYRLKDYNSIPAYLAVCFLFLAVATGFAVSIRENLLQVFRMAGNSMSPTLPEGARAFVRRDAYRAKDPQRNDLVAFRNPADRRQVWVKRVIGLPGDTLEIRSGVVYLNGNRWEEIATVEIGDGDLPPTVVPEHHCYVLGDHRANSRDSRHIGPVPMIALVGKVLFVR